MTRVSTLPACHVLEVQLPLELGQTGAVGVEVQLTLAPLPSKAFISHSSSEIQLSTKCCAENIECTRACVCAYTPPRAPNHRREATDIGSTPYLNKNAHATRTSLGSPLSGSIRKNARVEPENNRRSTHQDLNSCFLDRVVGNIVPSQGTKARSRQRV